MKQIREVAMDRKKQLLRLIHYTQNSIQLYVDTIPQVERDRTGLVDQWSHKDQLAHVAHWKIVFNQRLQKRDSTPQKITDVDKENAKVFEQHRNKSWDEVWAMFVKADEDLQHLIKLISEEDLNSTTLVPSLSGRPLWQSVVSDGCTHPLCHLGSMYIEDGRTDLAVKVQELIMDDLQSLDDSKRWRGTNIYNLACCYATAGLHDQAVDKLKESLLLHPDLREWSQHDSDLISLHEREDFIGLVAGQPTT
jgi:hypothetical protein